MRRNDWVALTLLLLTTGAQAQQGIEILRYEHLELRTALGTPTAAAKPEHGRSTLRFDAFGRTFDLELDVNARVEALGAGRSPSSARAYRGSLAGNASSWVRIVLTPRGPAGLVWDGRDLYALEAPGDSAVGAATATMFRLADVHVSPGTLGCATVHDDATATALWDATVQGLISAAALGADLNLDIGLVADAPFLAAFGADAHTALLTRLNNIDGIFSEQVGVQLTAARVDVLDSTADPFTTTDAEELLDELAVYRGQNSAQDAQGLTHLFTGRDLDGQTAGIAFLGAICETRRPFDPRQRSLGVGLSEARRGATLDSLVAAHEIGHSFGAPHDNEAGSACEATLPLFVMAPSVNGSDEFSQCSLEQMQPEIAAALCLTDVSRPDLALTAVENDVTLRAGESLVYGVRLSNLGAQATSSVAIDVDVANGMELRAAAVPSGACTLSATGGACVLENIGPGAQTTLELTFAAATPGDYRSTVTARTDGDAEAANDTLAVPITVVSVVDLVLSSTPPALTLGQTRRIEIALANAGDYTATEILLSAQLPSGSTVSAASLGTQSCSISMATVACDLDVLPPRATSTLAIDVTPTATGMFSLTAQVTAFEPEVTPDDNQLSRTISITSPAPAGATASSSGSGGGGSFGCAVFGLVPVMWRSRKRKAQRCRPAVP